jgi:LysM repeat protein
MRNMSLTAALPSTANRYTVVMPGQLAEPHFSADRASTTVYVRRRLLVSLVLATILAIVWLSAGNVLANRGGEPASASAVRPATSYLVQPGDTLWSIAAAHHGDTSQSAYVDVLVQINGGAGLQIGQVISLP